VHQLEASTTLWFASFEPQIEQVQKSLVYLGPNARLRRVVHDLIVGKHVRVGAIGGSITHGAKASKIGETDWFRCVGLRVCASSCLPVRACVCVCVCEFRMCVQVCN
jgi:hypothetical protein